MEVIVLDILSKNKLIQMPDRTAVSGLVYIQSYSVQPTKNGGTYVGGQLQVEGDMQFKCWSSTNSDSAYAVLCSDPNYAGKVCYVEGQVNLYGGEYSLLLSKLRVAGDEEYAGSVSDFFSSKYNYELWIKNLRGTLSKFCSPEAMLVFEAFMSDGVEARFCTEFAAISHHDNCRSGLLAHTTKVVKMATIIKMYPNIMETVSKDLLFLGCALHDIGKIDEYFNGSISKKGKMLSHNTLGIERVMALKDLIVCKLGEDFYYELISIIVQHHGEYGERPRTVSSVVVHMLDMLESKLATLEEKLETASGDQIQFEGYRLS